VAIGIIGKKIGMTHIFSKDGEMVPVTVIEAGPCAVIQKKTMEKEGYTALQLGFAQAKLAKLNKPMQGQFKKLDEKSYSVLREFRTKDVDQYEVGDEITADIFEPGEQVTVSGITKGKGFAGVIKRWGFHRGPMSHGSKHKRAPGSTGMSAYPGRVLKGKRMPGHAGAQRKTISNIEILDRREQENVILLKGCVPGAKNGILIIRKKEI